jgi:hypothetical protein
MYRDIKIILFTMTAKENMKDTEIFCISAKQNSNALPLQNIVLRASSLQTEERILFSYLCP